MLKYEFNLKLCKLNYMGKLSNWAWLDCVCTDSGVSVSCRFCDSRSCADGCFTLQSYKEDGRSKMKDYPAGT